MKIFAGVLAALFLGGCVNHPGDCALGVTHDDCLPGTAGYRPPPPVHDFAAEDDATCKSYGLKIGTGEYAECRERTVANRIAAAAMRRSPVNCVATKIGSTLLSGCD